MSGEPGKRYAVFSLNKGHPGTQPALGAWRADGFLDSFSSAEEAASFAVSYHGKSEEHVVVLDTQNSNQIVWDSLAIKISRLLSERSAVRPCPRCENKQFAFNPGYFTPSVQTTPTEFNLGGAVMPTVAMICTKCGFVSFHAIGVLGIPLGGRGHG